VIFVLSAFRLSLRRLSAALLGAAALTAFAVGTHAGPAAASVLADPAGVGAVVASDGSYHVFAAGADQHMYQSIYTGGTWSSPQDLGGYVHGVPAVVYTSSTSRYDLFAVGGNGDLYQQIYTGGSWHGWNDIAAADLSGGVTAVVVSGVYHVFATGADHHLYQTIYSGGVWSALQDLGSSVYGAPAVIYRSDQNRYDLFAVGGNGDLYQQIYTGGTWHGWNDIVSTHLAGGVAATLSSDGTYHVFATGDDQHLYQTIYTGGVWSAMQDLGGYVHGGPGLTYRSDVSRYDLFGVGGTGHIYQQIYTGGTWHGWHDIVSGVNFGTGSSTSSQATQIVNAAQSQEGLPYCFGAGTINGPTNGCGTGPAFDCSGLSMYAVYQGAGVVLPHSAADQYNGYQTYGGIQLDSQTDLLPGDLVFFVGSDGTTSAPGHVGVYIGNGNMIDAPTYGIPVGVHALYSDYVGAVRYWH